MTRVLLAGDDKALMQAMELMLSAEGFDAYGTYLGEEAVELALLYPYDIILLDLNLPDRFGYNVLRSLRARQVRTPVLIISGLSPDNEAVWRAFGAQDFLLKPFHKGDLIIRIHAVARGAAYAPGQALVTGGLAVNLIERSATVDGTALDLTGTEYELLEWLALRAGETVALQQFAWRLYGHRVGAPGLDVIDDLMDRLRSKLDEASPPAMATSKATGIAATCCTRRRRRARGDDGRSLLTRIRACFTLPTSAGKATSCACSWWKTTTRPRRRST